MFPRRAGERRGLEHDQLTLRDRAGQRPRGVEERAEIRLPVAGQRRGDTHEDRFGLVELDEPVVNVQRSSTAPRRSAGMSSMCDSPARSAATWPGRLDPDHVLPASASRRRAVARRSPCPRSRYSCAETVAAAYGRRTPPASAVPAAPQPAHLQPAARERSSSARVSGHGGPSGGPSASSRAEATTSSVPRGATNAPTRAIARERTDSGSDCTVTTRTRRRTPRPRAAVVEEVGDDVVHAVPGTRSGQLARPSARRRTR